MESIRVILSLYYCWRLASVIRVIVYWRVILKFKNCGEEMLKIKKYWREFIKNMSNRRAL